MTKNEYDTLRRFICSNHSCNNCPIDEYNPCHLVTPEKDLLFYARKENLGCSPKILAIIRKYSKAVII